MSYHQLSLEENKLKMDCVTLARYKRGEFDLVAFHVIWGYLAHLFVIHYNVLTAFISVIKQIVKAYGLLVISCS